MGEDPTPTTTDTKETTETLDVKVNVDSVTEVSSLPMHSKLAHVLAAVVSGVIALFVSAVLADGKSVIQLKDTFHLPVITNPALKADGFNHRLDELLGPTYGIGLHHDQSGRSWTKIGAGDTLSHLLDQLGKPVVAAALPRVIMTDALKHPVPLLECKDLQIAGLTAMTLGFVAESVAVVMIIFHCLVLAGLLPMKHVKPLAALIWATLTGGFLIVVLLATGIYTATWECNNEVIPSIKISDHFDYNYGFPFACVGYVSALLVFVVMLLFTSSTDGDPKTKVVMPNGGTIAKAAAAVTGGILIGSAGALIVLGANGVFDSKPPVDPTVNPCAGQKPYDAGPHDRYFSNVDCMKDNVVQVLEQAGANVTRGYKGLLDAGERVPITKPYDQTDLCPVNVHWHLGAEHYSAGQYDGGGKGPAQTNSSSSSSSSMSGRRELAGDYAEVRRGFRCHHYNEDDAKFNTDYAWQHCTNMVIGETYEVHWPHSAAGACGTAYQYQSPFYDGVFCKDGVITIAPLNTYETIGVQGQVFTIVNSDDPAHYYPNLISGMLVEGDKGADMAMYTGSTTGTSRDNFICSRYTPITWQVDRKCHMVSASSFDKMCADMMAMADDMSSDVHPHGARELVSDQYAANNQQSRK